MEREEERKCHSGGDFSVVTRPGRKTVLSRSSMMVLTVALVLVFFSFFFFLLGLFTADLWSRRSHRQVWYVVVLIFLEKLNNAVGFAQINTGACLAEPLIINGGYAMKLPFVQEIQRYNMRCLFVDTNIL